MLFRAYDNHLEQLTAAAERVCRVLREAGISYRQRDKTHIIDMDSVGLITPEIEAGLSDALRDRLQRVRSEEAQSTGAE